MHEVKKYISDCDLIKTLKKYSSFITCRAALVTQDGRKQDRIRLLNYCKFSVAFAMGPRGIHQPGRLIDVSHVRANRRPNLLLHAWLVADYQHDCAGFM